MIRMSKILIITVILMFLLLPGCASLKDYKSTWISIKDMWNYDYSKDPIDWKAEAGFYQSNYPDCTKNEKAQMLADSMKNNGAKPIVVNKHYRISVTHVYDADGNQIWPVVNDTDKRHSLEKFADTMKELEKDKSVKNQLQSKIETND